MKNLAFCLLLLTACTAPPDYDRTTPDIGVEQMAQIMADVHIAEAGISNFGAGERDTIAATLYGYIYDIHEVPESTYYANLQLYNNQPERLNLLYARVMEILGERKAELEGRAKPPERDTTE